MNKESGVQASVSDSPAKIRASVNYLSADSHINRRFVAPGAEINTGRYLPHEVDIHNARIGDAPTLDTHGFTLARHRSAIDDFHDREAIDRLYPDEVLETVKAMTGADLVVPLGWMLRTSGDTSAGQMQPPAGEVHVDMLPQRADRLADMLAEKAGLKPGGYRRFIASSLWRPISTPPHDWSLAVCDFRSVDPDEGVANVMVNVEKLPEGDDVFAELPGEDRLPAASVFRFNPAHRWYYYPDMTRDEVLMFKFYDSDHSVAWRAPHTAFEDPHPPRPNMRESIEFRTVAYFL